MNENGVKCFNCGACCTAYSIAALDKPSSVPCKNLRQDNKCGDYENRPQVCRDFKADNLCIFISTLPKAKRNEILRKIYENGDL